MLRISPSPFINSSNSYHCNKNSSFYGLNHGNNNNNNNRNKANQIINHGLINFINFKNFQYKSMQQEITTSSNESTTSTVKQTRLLDVNSIKKSLDLSYSSSSTISSIASSPTSSTHSYKMSSTSIAKSQSIYLPSRNHIQSATLTKSYSIRRYDPNSVQKNLLEWCQLKTRNYKNVDIRNFSSSWSDGLAFCALVHSHLPDSFDYEKLHYRNRRQNFELAFAALESVGIAPLLEVNDMILMGDSPDYRCIFTYVSTIYTRFKEISFSNSNSRLNYNG